MKDLEKTIVGIMFGKQIDEAKIKHPNQQALDVHEPEKDELTAKDFEMLRKMKKGEVKKEEVEMDESIKTTHENPLVTVHDKNGLHTHANLSVANDIFGTEVKPSDVHKGEVKTKSRAGDIRFNISKHHEKAMKEEVEKESKKDFDDRQKRLAAASNETAKDPERLKKLSKIPGYTAAMDLAKKTTKEEVEQFDEAVKPNELHVSDAGGGRYKVHAVGSNFADGIKVGEHLNDTHLDDFHEMGGKVKMIKPKQKSVAEGFNKMTPQQKAHEYNLDAAQREMDRRHAEGEDMTGAKIDKKTYQIIKPKKTNEEAPKTPSPFDWKNKPSELPTKKGEKAGFDSKKISTGTVYSRRPVKEELDQSTSFYNDFEVQLQESYSFGDYLTAAKQIVEDTEAVEMANEMFKAQDTDIFVIESILKSGIQARINSQLDAGLEVSAPKYSIEDGIPSVEYVVTEQDGKRRQYIHFGSIV
jgi:hypothetical protein